MSHNQVLDDSPWLAPEAILAMDSFLASLDKPRVFEWGAGGSSLWFAERAEWAISIEHDREWCEKTQRELTERALTNIKLIERPESFCYAKEIVEYAEYVSDPLFDLVLVDGVQRNACVLAAVGGLKVGGWLVLDNTEREQEYADALSLLKDWERKDYQGDGFQTSIFIKP